MCMCVICVFVTHTHIFPFVTASIHVYIYAYMYNLYVPLTRILYQLSKKPTGFLVSVSISNSNYTVDELIFSKNRINFC